MKKTLSVFLSMILAFMCVVPAFAADGEDVTEPPAESTKKYSVSFRAPSPEFKGGYLYAKTIDGEIQYEEDPDGIYVFYDNRYMTMDNIFPEFWHEVGPERYSPVQYEGTIEVNEGETVAFRIVTSPEYNVATAAVFINDQLASFNAKDEYAVYVDRDLNIEVAEYDEQTGKPAILKNHFNVKLTSGDGYKVKTLKGENYNVVYYGGEFYFRVQILKGYTASGIKVTVQRGNNDLGEYLGEEFDAIGNLMGQNEELKSYGIDEDGCRLYKIENITKDCKVIVSGVQDESTAGVMGIIKRILRLILDFLGIKLDILDSFTDYHTVTVDAAQADGVTYEILRSSSDELSPNEFTVTSGEGITIVVTKKDPLQDVNVIWTPGNEMGTYKTNWVLDYNTVTGEVTYSAVYNIDAISEDMQIVIS